MRKIIQISVSAEGYFHCLCDDGSVWYQYDQVVSGGAIMSEWRRFKDIPQDDAQDQISDVIDAGIKEHGGIGAHDLLLHKICQNIEHEQAQISGPTEEYKDLQLLLELVDTCRGTTDLCGSGYQERFDDLEAVKKRINNLEVMI